MDLKSLLTSPPEAWPDADDLNNLLIKALLDTEVEPTERMLACELAGELIPVNDKLVEALLGVLSRADEVTSLRASAALALGPVLEDGEDARFDPEDGGPISDMLFDRARNVLSGLFLDPTVPSQLRRRVLESSLRSEENWHADAIRQAYDQGDKLWQITAVFGMSYVEGFEAEIIEALEADDPDLEFEAVRTAGLRHLDAAWPHIVALLTSVLDDKPLLLIAIEAVARIRPAEAGDVLAVFQYHDDEDVIEAVDEALTLAMMEGDSAADWT